MVTVKVAMQRWRGRLISGLKLLRNETTKSQKLRSKCRLAYKTTIQIKLLPSKLATNGRMWCKKTKHNNNEILLLPLSIQQLNDIITSSIRTQHLKAHPILLSPRKILHGCININSSYAVGF